MWQVFPKMTAGPGCDWRGMVMPVPHHVVSPPLNYICCPMKLILLRSNKWQRWCLSLTHSLLLPLWALCCLLFSLMFSSEGGLCNNNSRHDKREHMQPYRPYTLQRITQPPSTHCLTGWRDRGSGPWPVLEEWSQGCMCVWATVCLLGGGFRCRVRLREKELGEEMIEEEEGGEFWFPLLLSHDAIHSDEAPQAAHWAEPLDSLDGQVQDQSLQHGSERQNTEEEEGQLRWLSPFGSNCWHQRFCTCSRMSFTYKQWLIVCSTGPTNGLCLFTWRPNSTVG